MNIEKEVIKIIERFHRLYQYRNTDELVKHYDETFSTNAIVIGTSLNEICLDRTSILQLFKDDVEGWGDVRLDLDKVVLNNNTQYITASLPFFLSQSFSTTEQLFETFMNLVIPDIDQEYPNPALSALEQSFLLHHILLDRDSDTRQYEWTFHLDIIFVKTEDTVLIQHMIFSYPFTNNQFDVLLGVDGYNDAAYNKEIHHSETVDSTYETFITTFLKKELDVQHISLDWIHEVTQDSHTLFTAIGQYQQSFEYQKAYDETMTLLQQKSNPKMMLFHLMQSHLYHLKLREISELHIPFRVVATISPDKKVESYIITYPYQMILENKNRLDIRIK